MIHLIRYFKSIYIFYIINIYSSYILFMSLIRTFFYYKINATLSLSLSLSLSMIFINRFILLELYMYN